MLNKKLINASKSVLALTVAAAVSFSATAANTLPTDEELREVVRSVVGAEINGGAGLHFWAIIVDRDNRVRNVIFTGDDRQSQLPIGRVVSTAKASTANALSLPNFVVSTPQLSGATLANGLFQNLPNAYPVSNVAYEGPSRLFGTRKDPMLGQIIGGATALGGGLALFNDAGEVIGGLGIGGEVHPCADHNAAWMVRDMLGLDNLAPGIGFSATGDDNIVYDLDENGISASGFGTIECSPQATAISATLPTLYPIGPN
ncbi:hypothetical protein [Sessilibacter sp. MAH2]